MTPVPADEGARHGAEALKREVLAELKEELAGREALKAEILGAVGAEIAKKRSPLFQHPAFLLVLGFLLTGGVGTWLTSYWQNREQAKQQAQQAHKRAIDQKYEIADQINKAVAEAYTAALVLSFMLSYGQGESNFAKELAERETYWKQARRNWMVNSQVLNQKLRVNFKSGKAAALYDEIIDEGDQLSVQFNNVVPKLKTPGWIKKNPAAIDAAASKALSLTNSMRDKTTELMLLMIQEIDAQEKLPVNAPTPAESTR